MSPSDRNTPANDASVEPAHPAPAQSPRPLGRDGLPEKQWPATEKDLARPSPDDIPRTSLE